MSDVDDVEVLSSVIADGVVEYFRSLPLTGSDDPDVWADEHEIAKRGEALCSARAVLASEWLVRHDADVAARALEGLADQIAPDGYGWRSVMDAERFREVLRKRATAIRGQR